LSFASSFQSDQDEAGGPASQSIASLDWIQGRTAAGFIAYNRRPELDISHVNPEPRTYTGAAS